MRSDHGELPLVVDVERGFGDSSADCARMEAALSHFMAALHLELDARVMISSGHQFWTQSFCDSKTFRDYPLWLAHYTPDPPRLFGGWERWEFWQYTDHARIAGTALDRDRFRADESTVALVAAAALGAMALFMPHGARRTAAMAVLLVLTGVAMSWAHSRHNYTKAAIAESDRKIKELEDRVAGRDVEIAAHQRTIEALQKKSDEVQPQIARDEKEAAATARELDRTIDREAELDAKIEAAEKQLKAEER